MSYIEKLGDNMVKRLKILIDNEFSNLIIEFKRNVKKSFEGEAFVTIGIDENDKISYISIEPLDKDLKEGIKRIKVL
ncbi:hypothetical protein SIRV1gp04 [Sulfolobus islandicus rod-shaped virus 1]|uniref:Uncharacterized protein 76 n=1 Tax=Sulfolobus islandicus rod-shaped virus 1 TaxID=157898 RepID=Y76_SIRV1|nr:hypothetical protein SIRV1gp04 [Sulfolobus islandicus rod-shaped virus 1]Q8QL50.1 RecName: Full=Uncharacterized protein 76 [Sulfolobus islandicus rod-shaped virus 1]CAC93959.1 hypothetical protein [Sulfolobus islandicus rod-shaped virus 1]CAG38824.1 hypothetical protein [Sulfolobus islandicus rudivirus 1 variant XX]